MSKLSNAVFIAKARIYTTVLAEFVTGCGEGVCNIPEKYHHTIIFERLGGSWHC